MAFLFQRNNGFYYAVYRDGSRVVWHSLRTRDKAEAEAGFQAIKPTLDRRRPTMLKDLADAILKYVELNNGKGTVDLYRVSMQHLVVLLGNAPLRLIGPMDGERFKEHLLKTVTNVSANVYLRTIKSMFNTAVRLDLMKENPFKNCRLLRIPAKDPVYIPKADFAKLLQTIGDERFRSLVLFSVLTGMRRGELINLLWSDIDLPNRLIRIRNKEDFTVKTMRPRTIPINKDLFRLIEGLPRRSDHVFVDRKGMPLKGGYVTKKFKQYIRSAGLSEQFHWHHLRSTFASYLVQSSTPLAEVQRLLGHSSVVTTQQSYAVLNDDNLRNATDKIQLDEFTPKGLVK